MQLLWRDVEIGQSLINTSLTALETVQLRLLAKDADVLEIGSAYGYSTVAIGMEAKSVVAVDPHITHGSYDTLVGNLVRNGIRERVDVRVGTSQDVLPRLDAEGRRFDLVWIDGDHTDAVVEHDVRWALKLLKPGGTLACHDYGEVTCPGVRVALDRLFGGPGVLTHTLAVYTNPELQ